MGVWIKGINSDEFDGGYNFATFKAIHFKKNILIHFHPFFYLISNNKIRKNQRMKNIWNDRNKYWKILNFFISPLYIIY